MRIDVKLAWSADTQLTLGSLAEQGRSAEAAGYSGLWSAESAHDPFLPLVAAAQATSRIELGTAIAVAFARSPMQLAYAAYDLQVLTEGRFLLGLGSQIRPHIQRRFDMPWSKPAARMREYVEALHAIWSAWAGGDGLDFHGEFYTHTLMTSFFSPRPSPWGPPKIYLAAVGEHMTEVAGAVCDGLMPHPFTTDRYLREQTLPTVHRGLRDSRRSFEQFSVSFQGLVASGRTEEEMTTAVRRVREQIAFYGSTPAYHKVLELHGWADLGCELNALSRSEDADRWVTMGRLIDDEVLAAFAVVAEPDRVGDAIAARYGDVVDRFNFYAPYPHDPDLWKPAIDQLSLSADERPTP